MSKKRKGIIMGGIIGAIVLIMGIFALFYESQEDYEARVIEVTQAKIEQIMMGDENWAMYNNKQWSYRYDEATKYEIVSVDGYVYAYGMSEPLRFDIYIDSDGYVCRITYTANGVTNGQYVIRSENSKLDL